jgi:hypothetical protein
MEKEKRELDVPAIILSLFGIFTAVLVISFVYLSINGSDYTKAYREENGKIKEINELNLVGEEKEIEIINQANLSNSQEEMVRYIAIALNLYNLHETPYTKITPKIQVGIDGDFYFVEISQGKIIINKGEIVEKDITIVSSSEEIIKIQGNESYAKESILSGKTTVEKMASDFTLFSKGYLDLYKSLNL